MPLYEYECTDCGTRVVRIRSIAERDETETCESCNRSDAYGPGLLMRVPSAPAFTIDGYNAANGYAKTGGA